MNDYQAWPFLIWRHALWGTRMMVMPGFIVEAGMANQLTFRLQDSQCQQPSYLLLPGTVAGDLAVVYRSYPAREPYTGGDAAWWIVGLVIRNGDVFFVDSDVLDQVLHMLGQVNTANLQNRAPSKASPSLPVALQQRNGYAHLCPERALEL
jgi:hypothetical protein